MSVVAYRFRRELRARWRAWLAIAFLVGIGGGIVTAAAAGARRTETAHARFLEQQHAADAAVFAGCLNARESCAADLAALPAVEDMTIQQTVPGIVRTPTGELVEPGSDDACFSGPGAVEIVGDESNRLGRDIQKRRFLSGRAADPTRADEVVISETIAKRHGLGIGDALLVTVPNFDSCNETAERVAELPPAHTYEVTIVGVHRQPLELRPASSFYFASVGVTPAFLERVNAFFEQSRATLEPEERSDSGFFTESLALVTLRSGASHEDLQAQFDASGLADDFAEEFTDDQGVVNAHDLYGPVADNHRPYAAALAIAALVGLLAVSAVIMPILFRQLRLETADNATLLQLGATPSTLRHLAAARAAAIAVVAALVTVVSAIVLSVATPIGPARIAEPDPGVTAPVATLAIAGLFTALFVFLAALPTIVRVRVSASRRSELASIGAAARQLPVAGWCGTRVAFARASHAGSGIASLTIATAMVLATLGFSAGVEHLLATPRLVGENWDAGLMTPDMAALEEDDSIPPEEIPTAEEFYARLVEDPAVAEYGLATMFAPFWQGQAMRLEGRTDVYVTAFEAGTVAPSLISGREPRSPDEILVGPKTLDEIDRNIGDEISVSALIGEWEDPEPEAVEAKYRIVGTGVVFESDELGTGTSMTMDGIRRLAPDVAPHVAWLRLAGDADSRGLVTRVYGEHVPVERVFFAGAGGFSFAAREDSLDIGRVDAAPLVIAGLLGLLGIAVLAHLVVSGLAANRRSLAILAALGLSPAQRRATIRWQGLAFVVIPVAVGVPLGVVLGRVVFREYATRLGVVPEPVTPWVAVALAIPAALLFVGLVTLIPAFVSARTRVVSALRAE